MHEHEVGKAIGNILARLDELEKKVASQCGDQAVHRQNEKQFSLPWFAQKYVTPSPRAGDCVGPNNGECNDQDLIICAFQANTKGEVDDWLKNHCTDENGNPKKC